MTTEQVSFESFEHSSFPEISSSPATLVSDHPSFAAFERSVEQQLLQLNQLLQTYQSRLQQDDAE